MTWSLPVRSTYLRSLAIGAGAGLLLAGLLASRNGYAAQVILSTSMAPRLKPGYVVITKRLAPTAYRTGDVVTFRAPIRGRPLVTHRIIRTERLGGVVQAETKGDANTDGDPWSISAGAIVGRERAYIPFVGYGLGFWRSRSGFLAVAGCTFLFFVLRELCFMGTFLRRSSNP